MTNIDLPHLVEPRGGPTTTWRFVIAIKDRIWTTTDVERFLAAELPKTGSSAFPRSAKPAVRVTERAGRSHLFTGTVQASQKAEPAPCLVLIIPPQAQRDHHLTTVESWDALCALLPLEAETDDDLFTAVSAAIG